MLISLQQNKPQIAFFFLSSLFSYQARFGALSRHLERSLSDIRALEVQIVHEPQRPRKRLVVIASPSRLDHGAVLGVGAGQSEGHALVVAWDDLVDCATVSMWTRKMMKKMIDLPVPAGTAPGRNDVPTHSRVTGTKRVSRAGPVFEGGFWGRLGQ